MSDCITLNPKTTTNFWKKVEAGPFMDCWLWTASKLPDGYGRFAVNRRLQLAHRVSWIIHNGPIPEGMLICHRCDCPSCVNPYHLYAGTASDNMQDMIRKDRRKPCKGEGHPITNLSNQKVLEIRKLWLEGSMTQLEIAKRFSVRTPAIWKIVHRYTWTHI